MTEEMTLWEEMLCTKEMDDHIRDIQVREFEEIEAMETAKENPDPLDSNEEPWIDPAGGVHCGSYFSEE
jgi:hypothetical protein